MLPYCQYKYEVTHLLNEKDNLLEVDIFDVEVVFGPSEGWENYSGIIRDVYIEYTDTNYIKDYVWTADLINDYNSAICRVKAEFEADDSLAWQLVLKDANNNIVYNRQALVNENELTFEIDSPNLWSPKSPNLYTLEIQLLNGNTPCDSSVQRVGFKELKTKGKRFYLNGEPLFLVGVCRHDLFGDSGHIVSEEQMQQDLRMIKDAGVNYVRLVHYPHNKRILEIADELGLMVSEEPGLWWSDVKDEQIFNGSLQVLEKTIIRDRNHVCVAFWLSFNECIFTPEFLVASAKVCRENDPSRMVSGANCMDIEMTKKYFYECEFDFYTMHPYSPTTERMIESAVELNDKPLLLTEWGGYHVYNNPNLFNEFVDEMINTWNNDEDKPVIAGAALWCWAEVYEFNRAAPACHDGILNEGLVDIYRNPLMNLKIFKEAYERLENPKKINYELDITNYIFEKGDYSALDLSREADLEQNQKAWNKMIERAKEPIARFRFDARRLRVLNFGPVLREDVKNIGDLPVNLLKQPIVLQNQGEISFEINQKCSKLFIIGNVSMPKGFPIGGAYGEAVCEYEVTYDNGKVQNKTLYNGKEITTAAAWYGPSRINPIAENSKRVIRFFNDKDREHYVINLFTLELEEANPKALKIRVINEGYDLLLYGITEKNQEL